MSGLFFVGARDHALIALVISEAQASNRVSYFGRTALQKIVYFLKVLGVPSKYQFTMHHFGPFCDQIGSDVELLVADGVVVDRATDPAAKYSNYGVGAPDRVAELLDKHRDYVDVHRPAVRTVVNVFGGLDPSELELYATLHYAYRYEQASLDEGAPPREAVVSRFKQYKRDKFTDAQIVSAYDAMLNARLIAAA